MLTKTPLFALLCCPFMTKYCTFLLNSGIVTACVENDKDTPVCPAMLSIYNNYCTRLLNSGIVTACDQNDRHPKYTGPNMPSLMTGPT